jgi:hypothetical protein
VGGLCQTNYWLSVTDPSRRIDTLNALKDTFASVESETEAMSFVAVTQRDLCERGNDGDILDGATAAVSDTYLVQAVDQNIFG